MTVVAADGRVLASEPEVFPGDKLLEKTVTVRIWADDNNGGNANPQLYGGVEMGTNICGGDTVCP